MRKYKETEFSFGAFPFFETSKKTKSGEMWETIGIPGLNSKEAVLKLVLGFTASPFEIPINWDIRRTKEDWEGTVKMTNKILKVH